jgi:hypothetical protein
VAPITRHLNKKDDTNIIQTEKSAALSREPQEKFGAVKTAESLEAFFAAEKTELTDEEKKTALEYVTTGLKVITDGELEAVAGGYLMPQKTDYIRFH